MIRAFNRKGLETKGMEPEQKYKNSRIYTLTFNPSLDYIVDVHEFELCKTNRTSKEKILPGGKGINVSKVLKNLGYESTALGFVAGFTGCEIERLVDEGGVKSRFIMLEDGESRINVKIRNIEGTEINGMGPRIASEDLDILDEHLDELQENDILVLAGNVSAGVNDSIYKDIMMRLQRKSVVIAVDATKTLLLSTLPCRPFLIKPNQDELEEMFNITLDSPEEILLHAKKLQDLGARNVLISRGGQGAILLTEEGVSYQANVPQGTLVNAVGAGDSMVAGFLAGYIQTGDYAHAFKMGIATGSASAFSENLATKSDVERLYDSIEVNYLTSRQL